MTATCSITQWKYQEFRYIFALVWKIVIHTLRVCTVIIPYHKESKHIDTFNNKKEQHNVLSNLEQQNRKSRGHMPRLQFSITIYRDDGQFRSINQDDSERRSSTLEGPMMLRVGDLVEQKSNGTKWIVTHITRWGSLDVDYSITVRRSTWLKYGHGGSRICSPAYYRLICRPNTCK
jgi:hypothetical protein